MGIERRDDGIDYVYFVNGLCKPVSEVGFLNPYEQYEEDCYDWSSFRREAAKDIVCAILSAGMDQTDDNNERFHTFEELAEVSVKWADTLIAKLKEK